MPRDVPSGGNVPAGEPTPAAQRREEFAARLRELRIRAGSPSFRQLARITHYSSSTLADATSGRRLPTEPVVRAFASACGADPAPWTEELLQLAAAEQAGRSGSEPAGPDGAMPADADGHDGGRPPLMTLVVVGVVVVVAVVVFGAGLAAGRMMTPSPSASATIQELPGVPLYSGTPSAAPVAGVTDGTDPVAGHCAGDARLVDKEPVMTGGTQIGALELWYSPRCGAGWARTYLYPGEPTMLGEATVRSADGRFASFTDPLAGQIPVYTNVIVPGSGGCLGAGGAVWEMSKPVIMVSIPCQAP